MRRHVDQLLQALSGELKLNEALVLNAEDACLLALDGVGLVLALDEKAGLLIATGIVGHSPESAAEAAFARKALCGNFYWSATAGGTLAIDAGTNLCCLHLPFFLPQEDSANFIAAVGAFVSAVEYWQKELNDPGGADIVSVASGLRV